MVSVPAIATTELGPLAKLKRFDWEQLAERSFDRKQLAALLELRSISARRLAAQCGLSKSTIDRILSGDIDDPGGSKVISLFPALDISVRAADTFYNWLPPYWERFSGLDGERMDQLFRSMSRSANCLTVNVRQDVYFIPESMLAYDTGHITSGWPKERLREWQGWLTTYRQERRDFRKRHWYRNTVVVPRRYYSLALPNNLAGLTESIEHIREFADTSPVIVLDGRAWVRFTERIKKFLGIASLDKLTIINNATAYVRPTYFEALVTYHRPTVTRLREFVEWCLRRTTPGYNSKMSDARLLAFRDEAVKSVRALRQFGY